MLGNLMIKLWRCIRGVVSLVCIMSLAWLLGSSVSAWAQTAPLATSTAKGSQSGLPIPRFVSLKSGEVNVRRGPARDHETAWTFKREGLPVEITAEWDTWRRIRYADGSEGWVFHGLLSGRRMAMVAPWSKDEKHPIRAQSNAEARIVAYLEPTVIGAIKRCNGKWCQIEGRGFEGWIEQGQVWGAYPNEVIE